MTGRDTGLPAGVNRRHVAGALVALCACVSLAAAMPGRASASPAAMPLGEIQAYTVPTGSGGPLGIVAGPDGNLWFTEDDAGKVGVISTAGSFLHEYTMPEGANEPGAIASGPNGQLWFTENGSEQIGEISTSGSFTEFPVTGAPPVEEAITAGTDNGLWFPEGAGGDNTIDRIPASATSADPQVTKATIPTSGADPAGIATDSGGNLWFTEDGTDKIGELTPPDTFHEYPVTDGYTFPGGIAAGPNDSMWFTEHGGIGEISGAGSITQFALSSPLGGGGSAPDPNSIAAGPDGNLWFTVNVGNESDGWIGRLTPTGSVTYYTVSGPAITGPNLARITAGPDGNMWFTELDGNAIGVIGTASGGSAPLAGVSPTSIPFGAGTVGLTGTAQSVTVHNTGGAALVIGTITVTGAQSGAFPTSDDGCSGETIAPGDSCTVDVAFDPPAAGSYSAQLSVPDNAADSPQTVALSGSAEPDAGLSGTLDFGQLDPGRTSPSMTETVTNTGGAPLELGTVRLSGAQATAFTIGTDGCSGQTIAPGGTCMVAATFSPPAAGSYSASLQVSDNAAGSPQTATVEGYSANPVTLSPGAVEFGAGTVGEASAAQTVTLLASGTAAVSVSRVAVSGPQADDFAITSDTCTGRTVSAGGACTVAVEFEPAAAGSDGASLVFADSADTSPQTVALQGGSEPAVTVAGTLSFPAQAVGVTSAAETLTVFNTGQAPLGIAGVAVTGPQAGAFAISSDGCSGQTVAAGGSCSLSVTFTPPANASDVATLTVTDDAPGNPQSVALSGTVTASTVTAAPDSLAFGDVAGGSTAAPQDVTVTDAGPGTLALTGASLTGAGASAFRITSDGCAGQALAASDTCQIAVAYAPPASGVYDATLVIDDDGAASPQQVALSGGTSLSGHVYDAADGAPVAGADVIACQAPTCVSYSETTTAADGSYTIPRLSPGLWQVNVTPVTDPAGLSPGSAEVPIAGGQGVVQDFDLIAPQPISDGVSFDVGGGSQTSGVPVITANTPFSFNVPIRLGRGPVYGEHTFAFLSTVGLAGSGGSAGGAIEGAMLTFTVKYNATGFPTSMSPIIVGSLLCGSPGTPSPCASVGGGVEHAAAAHGRGAAATAPTRAPIATIADDCPSNAPPGAPSLLNFRFAPNTNGGVEVTDATGTAYVFDPIGLAQPSPTGDPLQDAQLTEKNLKAGTLNTIFGAVLSPVGIYNTVVQTLSGTLASFTNVNGDPDSASAGAINAGVNIAVATFGQATGATEKDSLIYAAQLLAGDTSTVLAPTTGVVQGGNGGGITFPYIEPPLPCPGAKLGGGGGGGSGGGSGGGAGGSGGGGAGGGGGGGGNGGTLGGTAFIDPSGIVRSATGIPLTGAKVTLTRASTARGRQRPVRSHSRFLSPESPLDPEYTSLLGSFGWYVAPGFYRETATRPGCTAPAGRNRSRSPVQAVPPPRTNAILILSCPHLHRRPSLVRLRVVFGPLRTAVVRATIVAAGPRARAAAHQPVVGTVTVRAGRFVERLDPNPATGLVIADAPVQAKSRHAVRVSYGGDADLSPSSALLEVR